MIELFSPVGGGGGGGYSGFLLTGMIACEQISKPEKIPGPKINPPAFNNPATVLSYFGGSEHRYRI